MTTTIAPLALAGQPTQADVDDAYAELVRLIEERNALDPVKDPAGWALLDHEIDTQFAIAEFRQRLLSPTTYALYRLVAADNCNYSRHAARYEGLFDAGRRALGWPDHPQGPQAGVGWPVIEERIEALESGLTELEAQLAEANLQIELMGMQREAAVAKLQRGLANDGQRIQETLAILWACWRCGGTKTIEVFEAEETVIDDCPVCNPKL